MCFCNVPAPSRVHIIEGGWADTGTRYTENYEVVPNATSGMPEPSTVLKVCYVVQSGVCTGTRLYDGDVDD
jgi:hypothetical protein